MAQKSKLVILNKMFKMIGKIKHRIVLKLKNVFHYLGFSVERIPNVNRLFEDLSNLSQAVQRHELKKIASQVRMANNHRFYNQILKRYVPDWDDNITSAAFIGAGKGEFSFDVYRKVCYNNKFYFEKIYFNNTYDLMKMGWFYEHVYPVLKHEIKTSKVFKITKGELITIVYFEFIDLIPFQKQDRQTAFVDLSKQMFSLSKYTEVLHKRVPYFLKDYRLHDEYDKSINAAKKTIKALSKNRLTAKKIEKIINTGPMIFTHGDIYDTNVFSGGYFIDWDSFGFFPLGFEAAIVLSFVKEEPTFYELQVVINDEYKKAVDANLWDSFKLNCFYFYLVLTALNPQKASLLSLQKDIMNRIEDLYNKKINCDHLAMRIP